MGYGKAEEERVCQSVLCHLSEDTMNKKLIRAITEFVERIDLFIRWVFCICVFTYCVIRSCYCYKILKHAKRCTSECRHGNVTSKKYLMVVVLHLK
ncbi:hypothetical protein L2E82_09109 [Cichorium intybus]|uniref:Uncharacterized protein n=1 Tax=Cichorium intybus TaxID=13427 RepID=A0ACB9G7I5_CICIN|nr:hypothetical protein L2E82_09109 [Cichorium intybus]